MRLAKPSYFTGMPPKLKETNIYQLHIKGLKYPTGEKRTSWLAIYKHDLGVDLESTEKQLLLSGLVAKVGRETATSVIQVRRSNHSTALPRNVKQYSYKVLRSLKKNLGNINSRVHRSDRFFCRHSSHHQSL